MIISGHMGEILGFRLLRVKISGHKVLKNVDIRFCDDTIEPVVYTTGVIGPNGTGKSHLMGAIATAFMEIRNAIESGNAPRKRFSFLLDYSMRGDVYSVTNISKFKIKGFELVELDDEPFSSLQATRNNRQIDLKEIVLPERVIASTMTITDKFLARTDEFYRYKGIRNERSASTTGTRTIIRKTIDSLMECMYAKSAFQEELSILLENLGLEKHLHVSYGMRYKNLFLRPDMSAGMIREIFDNWKENFPSRGNAPWGYGSYIRGLRDNEVALGEAARFLAEKARESESRKSVVATYDVMQSPWDFYRDSEALKVLSQLDLLSFPSINVAKKDTVYGLENSSSGETHLLCQFIGIMADIRHNSLILIDEPENSSHPNWQMNYVGWLKHIFREYRDCHFVIATHSPLILANLKATESTIVRLKRGESNRIENEGGMERGCYSWTMDEILQDVMEMRSSRTEEFNNAMKVFEAAVDNDDRERAEIAYKRLLPLIHPENVLAEVLRIQMIGLDRKEV